jgi:malonyl CoA-acyl carrier protein transacylase
MNANGMTQEQIQKLVDTALKNKARDRKTWVTMDLRIKAFKDLVKAGKVKDVTEAEVLAELKKRGLDK